MLIKLSQLVFLICIKKFLYFKNSGALKMKNLKLFFVDKYQQMHQASFDYIQLQNIDALKIGGKPIFVVFNQYYQ